MRDKTINWKDMKWVFLILILLLVVGSFFDLEIAKLLYHEGNLGFRIVEAFACLPFFGVVTMSATAFIANRNCANHFKSVMTLILGLVFIVASICGYGYYLYSFIAELEWYYALGISFVLNFLLGAWCGNLVNSSDSEEINHFISSLTIAVIIVPIVTLLLNILWNRPGYLDCLNGATFRAWYNLKYVGIVNFKQFEFLKFGSFPSIISTSSSYLFFLVLIPRIKHKYQFHDKIFLTLATILVIATTIIRVMLGFNYLSDIAMAILLSLVMEIIIIKLVYGD